MNLKLKLITGFRKDQHYTINADEAEKAYKLFMNPDHRGIFSNGLALVGSSIQAIEPDYNATMGWNPDHVLNGDDWNQINASGIDRQLRDALSIGKHNATSNIKKLS